MWCCSLGLLHSLHRIAWTSLHHGFWGIRERCGAASPLKAHAWNSVTFPSFCWSQGQAGPLDGGCTFRYQDWPVFTEMGDLVGSLIFKQTTSREYPEPGLAKGYFVASAGRALTPCQKGCYRTRVVFKILSVFNWMNLLLSSCEDLYSS